MHSIAGAGLLALDIVISEPHSDSACTYAGGTCGNVLAILGYFGWHATPIARIGDDGAGKRLLADLRQWSLNLDRVVVDGKCKTPVFVQTLHRDSEGRPRHSFSTACPLCGGALSDSSAAQVDADEFQPTDAPEFFFMDRLSPSILAMAASARRFGATIVYEPSVQSDQTYWQDALPIVDILKYAEDRFRPFDFDAHRGAGAVFWEVQTLGQRGLRFRRSGTSGNAQWAALDVVAAPNLVDSCGAGDWCTAGLLVALSTSLGQGNALSSPEAFGTALRHGQAYAAWACGFEGARGAMYASAATEVHSAVANVLNGSAFASNSYAHRKRRSTSSICDVAHGRSARK